MELLLSELKKIVENMRASEFSRKAFASKLREANKELGIIKPIGPCEPDKIKIAGVDGGIVKKSLHGFDLIIARAASACFEYSKGKILSAAYFPSKFPKPRPFTLESVSDIDFAYFASITRQKLEVDTARKTMEALKPDILLMDGSIVPHYSTKPSTSSVSYTAYEELIEAYQALYAEAEKSGILLAGVIEDSRSDRFCQLLKTIVVPKAENIELRALSTILDKSRDTNLLFWLLEKNEKTITFNYTPEADAHPILKDFAKNSVYSFYLKTAKWDRPVRVDLFDRESDEKLAAILLAISGQHRSYGFPSVLIEADNIAKLSEQEIENFYSSILSYAGNMPSVMKLRRDQRPF